MGIEFQCSYWYQPKERATYDYPGCEAEVQDLDVYIKGVNVTDILATDIQIKIEEELLTENK